MSKRFLDEADRDGSSEPPHKRRRKSSRSKKSKSKSKSKQKSLHTMSWSSDEDDHNNNNTNNPSDRESSSSADPEEARRLKKLRKQEKERKRILKQKEELHGYTNDSNPFNDSQLSNVFLWDKKSQQDPKYSKLSDAAKQRKMIKDAKKKRRELGKEILDTKARRAEREQNKETIEQMKQELDKEMEFESNVGWQEKEETFHLENALKRSQIRLAESRAKPIDSIARNIHELGIGPNAGGSNDSAASGGTGTGSGASGASLLGVDEIENPIFLISHLYDTAEFAQLLRDIEEFISLMQTQCEIAQEARDRSRAKQLIQHWEMVHIYAQHAFEMQIRHQDEMSALSAMGGMGAGDARNGRNDGEMQIYDQIEALLKNKSDRELEQFATKAEALATGRGTDAVESLRDKAIDLDYWRKVAKVCKVSKAKRFIQDKYLKLVARHKASSEMKKNEIFERFERDREAKSGIYAKETDAKDSKTNDGLDRDFESVMLSSALRGGAGLNAIDGMNGLNGMDGMDGTGRLAGVIEKTFDIPELVDAAETNDDMIPMLTKDTNESYYQRLLQTAVEASDDEDDLSQMRIKVLKASMERMRKQNNHSSNHHHFRGNANNNYNNKNYNNNNNNNNNSSSSSNSNKSNNSSNNSNNRNNSSSSSSSGGYRRFARSGKEDSMYRMEAAKGMEVGEVSFSNIDTDWMDSSAVMNSNVNDRYEARKPRYFNRVKTGYSWNKYNQTHYDPENPPPKIVQGYKFNIFYPDLMNPSVPPQYKIYTKDGSEYATIVFKAGPPYQDIAFKIVNNEIEANHKRGFRCRFEKGIFSLYFNFKRYRYRR